MPSVLFWNVARGGTGASYDDVNQSLTRLSGRQPEFIILAEMLKLASRTYSDRKDSLAPSGYVTVKPIRPFGFDTPYMKDTSLRYYVFGKKPAGSVFIYSTNIQTIPVRNSRPVLLLHIGTVSVIALHAPSVTHTSKPQAIQMKAAYDLATQLFNATPLAILGDMNIDLKSAKRVNSFNQEINGHALATWSRIGPGQKTQKRGGELDWALCAQGFTPAVTVIDTRGAPPRTFDEIDDDEEFNLNDEPVEKDSDHDPILVSW